MKTARQVALEVLDAIPEEAGWEEVVAQLVRARSLVLEHASGLIAREIWRTTLGETNHTVTPREALGGTAPLASSFLDWKTTEANAMKAEKKGDSWPDKPADENMSTDPPNQFDRDERDYEPGMPPPQGEGGGRSDEESRERGVPRGG